MKSFKETSKLGSFNLANR